MDNKVKQKELKYLGYYKYKIDGIFGNLSKKATKEFQKDYGLKIDGIFGSNTINKMLETWKLIQLKLNKLKLKIDGIVGNETINEIKIFQQKNNLEVNGILDKINLKKLRYLNKIKPRYPLNYIGITQGFKFKTHNGIDLGWNKEHDGKNPLIYAPLDMRVLVNSSASDAGNYIIASSDYNETNDMLFRFLHLKETPKLNKYDVIPMNSSFAVMGNTGRSTGNHLHFEVWIVPKNYNYYFSERYSYLKNPLEYIYIYPNQVISELNTYKLLIL